jgi:hypothetical protein
VYDVDRTRFVNEFRKLTTDFNHVELVASPPVLNAASDLLSKFTDCANRVVAGAAYVQGKPVDAAYQAIPLRGEGEVKEFASLDQAFVREARIELRSTKVFQ